MAREPVPGAGKPSPSPSQNWPGYEATQPTFVNGRIYVRGEQFRSDQKPGKTWKLIDAGKPAASGAKGKGKQEAPAAAAAGDGETGRAADQSPI